MNVNLVKFDVKIQEADFNVEICYLCILIKFVAHFLKNKDLYQKDNKDNQLLFSTNATKFEKRALINNIRHKILL